MSSRVCVCVCAVQERSGRGGTVRETGAQVRAAPARGETADGSKNGPEQGTEILRLQPAPRYCTEVSRDGQPRFIYCFFRDIVDPLSVEEGSNIAESRSAAGCFQGFGEVAWRRDFFPGRGDQSP